MYSSKKLSKLLSENGCKLTSNYWSVVDSKTEKRKIIPSPCSELYGHLHNYYAAGDRIKDKKIYYSYDILNDICVKYAKEFFGRSHLRRYANFDTDTERIFHLLQQNKIQEAEDYIWEHCLFNH